MSNRRGFAEDLDALSTAVETDVSRVMTLLRAEQPAIASGYPATASSPAPRQKQTNDELQRTEAPMDPSTAQRRPSPAKPRQKPTIAQEVILVNVTTRLQRQTNDLLTDAALRQKLKKQTPATRQDIVEEALGDWLRKQGYDDGA